MSSSRDTIKLKPTVASAPSAPVAPAITLKPISLAPKIVPPTPSSDSAAGVPATSSAPGESEPKAPPAKSGLTVKMNADSVRKGPPRAAAEEAQLKLGKNKRGLSGDTSFAFTSFCFLMILCLLFTAFLSAAHYFNTWQPELVKKHLGERIAVPVLDDQIKNR